MSYVSVSSAVELAPLAAVIYPKGAPVDALLREAVVLLQARGLHVAGVIQESADGGMGCELTALRETDSGHVTSITENRGKGARGCKLDPCALADVAARLEECLEDNPDLLVINRFGKSEIEGRGLRSVLSEALLRGIPVLTAVREINAGAWADFHQGLAVDLPPQREALMEWAQGV
jgi:hypothetical protein